MSALPATTGLTLLTEWRVDWIALGLGTGTSVWYLRMRHRLIAAGQSWTWTRTTLFGLGIAGYLWCTSGFPNAYAATLFWVWSIQVLALLLLVPVLLMGGQPVLLAARTARRRSLLAAVTASHPARLIAHPFVGPTVIPVVTAVLFFGHVAHLWTANTWSATGIGVALVAIGCLVAVPLSREDLNATSLAVGVVAAISVLELLTDAIPGIVLRLTRHLVSSHFATRHAVWAMSALADQKLSAAILWGVAELLDLPFLVVMFMRWARTDQREAVRTDQALAAARPAVDAEAAASQPWWLTDAQLADRPGFRPPGSYANARTHVVPPEGSHHGRG